MAEKNNCHCSSEGINFSLSSGYLQGPKSRWNEFLFASKIFLEFMKGFRKLHFVGSCITVFGSARITKEHKFYKQAKLIGKMLSELGFTVMTGGGPGIMEAANKGAQANGGRSVGCNIKLPIEQQPNGFMDTWIVLDHFFVRKVLLLKYSYGFIVMPGGLGTMDELFETLTLVQTGIIKNFPIVLFGSEYYSQLMRLLDAMHSEGTITDTDLDLLILTDSVEEAKCHIQKYLSNAYAKSAKPKWWLAE